MSQSISLITRELKYSIIFDTLSSEADTNKIVHLYITLHMTPPLVILNDEVNERGLFLKAVIK